MNCRVCGKPEPQRNQATIVFAEPGLCLDCEKKRMRKDGLSWLTLTLGSATNATDLIEVEEQIKVARSVDEEWLVTTYPTMDTTAKGKTLSLAILEYLKKRMEP